jgi:hypothetical protein
LGVQVLPGALFLFGLTLFRGDPMYRWFLVIGVWLLVGALGALFWLGWQVTQNGISLRLSEPPAPIKVEVINPVSLPTPLEVNVSSLPLTIPQRFSVAVEGPVQAETGLLRCPICGKGTVLPVRWNLLTGAIVWRCTACGAEFGP